MKRNILLLGLAGALGLLVAVSSNKPVVAGIKGSAHDFSGQSWSQGQICLPCHTPHNALPKSMLPGVSFSPLWNHQISTATYTMFFGTTVVGQDAQPTSSSKLCLGCHDGTVALDSYGLNNGQTYIGGSANLGTDLSNDHPISLIYDRTDTGLKDYTNLTQDPCAALNTADGKVVYIGPDTAHCMPLRGSVASGYKMQCNTCHSVHNTTGGGTTDLLYVSKAASAVCLSCHNK